MPSSTSAYTLLLNNDNISVSSINMVLCRLVNDGKI